MKQADLFEDQDLSGPGAEPASRPEPITTEALLAELERWSQSGWLRRLDSALASFLATLCPAVPPGVLLLTAAVSHLEGQGHSCLVVAELLAAPAEVLGWPDDATIVLGDTMRRLPATADGWLPALRDCGLVWPAPAAPDQHQPLVLSQGRLYLRRYWLFEQSVAACVSSRVAAPEAVDVVRARHWLARLFPGADGAGSLDWQKVACAITLRGRLSIVTGGPGTGKTYTAARVLALLFALDPAPGRLRVALAAPTGKAAARLKQAIDSALVLLQPQLDDVPALRDLAARIGPARTLHALLGLRPDSRRFLRGAHDPVDIDVLVVDEASMVHLEMMAALLEALPKHTRVVLLGDKDQLASVEAGAVLGELCQGADGAPYDSATRAYLNDVLEDPLPDRASAGGSRLAQQTVTLQGSRRFAGAIGALASAVNEGDVVAAERLLGEQRQAGLAWLAGASAATDFLRLASGADSPGGYRPYCERLAERPSEDAGHPAWVARVLAAFDGFRVLCAVRDGKWGVEGLNAAIEKALIRGGLLSRGGEWFEGRPVIVTRNDAAAGVFNGDVGITLRPPGHGALRVYFSEGAGLRSTPTTRLGHVQTAFAMTVHKSQGSEFAHTALVLPESGHRIVTRELLYTGITRARQAFTLVSAAHGSLGMALTQRTKRSSGLALALSVIAV